VADKPLQIISGVVTQVEAKQTSAGAGDAGKIVALDSGGRLDSTMMPVGVGVDSKSITASEALTGGNLVNVWDDSGTLKIRKADATTAGKEANGYVLASVSSAASGTVYFEQIITGLSSLTLGAVYYLSTTAGGITTTAPSASGNVVQRIGRAISATELLFQPQEPITLA
jgi:hypothetical protein